MVGKKCRRVYYSFFHKACGKIFPVNICITYARCEHEKTEYVVCFLKRENEKTDDDEKEDVVDNARNFEWYRVVFIQQSEDRFYNEEKNISVNLDHENELDNVKKICNACSVHGLFL
jgi:hypothetical protein